ncbi:MAG: type 1 periplasmic-binding domain-containing protein [Candidatus Dormibacteria bacterium]
MPGRGQTQANLSQLGLADSGTVGSGGNSAVGDAVQPTPLAEFLQGLAPGTVAQQGHCVGRPPRQTEDPLSPPCVAFWQGDNGGATAKGVTRNSITIVIATCGYGHDGFDYNAAPSATDKPFETTMRALLRYFQARFQTYGRVVHLINQNPSVNCDVADEKDAEQRYNPFAVIQWLGASEDYAVAAASQGTVGFQGVYRLQPAPTLSDPSSRNRWSFEIATTTQGRAFGHYLCHGIVGHPAAMAGDPAYQLHTRTLGIATSQSDQVVARGLQDQLATECNTRPKIYGYDTSTRTTTVAALVADGVTTVLQGDNSDDDGNDLSALMGTAQSNRYNPEWVWNGSALQTPGWDRGNGTQEWNSAFGITDRWRLRPANQMYWYQAALEAAPSAHPDLGYGSTIYYGLLMAFTAIQMAGPHLSPDAVESALTKFTAANDPPFSPRASYSPVDHTFVDDFMIVRDDRSGVAPGSSSPGCLRLADGGRRYLADGPWPNDDRAAGTNSTQPCQPAEVDPGVGTEDATR